MKKVMILLLSMAIALTLAACGSEEGTETPTNNAAAGAAESTTEAANETEKVNDSANSNETDSAPVDEGALGDYYVKILDASLGKDYEGKPAVIVRYEFTNNSEKDNSFMVAVSSQAFQDGVELSTAILADETEETDNSMKEVKTGATIVCQEAYELSNDTSDILVECSELFALNDRKIAKSFSLS